MNQVVEAKDSLLIPLLLGEFYLKKCKSLIKEVTNDPNISPLLGTLLGYSKGWYNHPAVRMWEGYHVLLVDYSQCMCDAWSARGFEDSVWMKVESIKVPGEVEYPLWWGDQRIIDSHRSNLLRKAPVYYAHFGWDVPDNLPYFWPK